MPRNNCPTDGKRRGKATRRRRSPTSYELRNRDVRVKIDEREHAHEHIFIYMYTHTHTEGDSRREILLKKTKDKGTKRRRSRRNIWLRRRIGEYYYVSWSAFFFPSRDDRCSFLHGNSKILGIIFSRSYTCWWSMYFLRSARTYVSRAPMYTRYIYTYIYNVCVNIYICIYIYRSACTCHQGKYTRYIRVACRRWLVHRSTCWKRLGQ